MLWSQDRRSRQNHRSFSLSLKGDYPHTLRAFRQHVKKTNLNDKDIYYDVLKYTFYPK